MAVQAADSGSAACLQCRGPLGAGPLAVSSNHSPRNGLTAGQGGVVRHVVLPNPKDDATNSHKDAKKQRGTKKLVFAPLCSFASLCEFDQLSYSRGSTTAPCHHLRRPSLRLRRRLNDLEPGIAAVCLWPTHDCELVAMINAYNQLGVGSWRDAYREGPSGTHGHLDRFTDPVNRSTICGSPNWGSAIRSPRRCRRPNRRCLSHRPPATSADRRRPSDLPAQ